jgi:hypothetical protein
MHRVFISWFRSTVENVERSLTRFDASSDRILMIVLAVLAVGVAFVFTR